MIVQLNAAGGKFSLKIFQNNANVGANLFIWKEEKEQVNRMIGRAWISRISDFHWILTLDKIGCQNGLARIWCVCVFFFLTRFCAGLWCAAQLSIGCIATAIIVYPNIDIVFVHIFPMWKRRAAAHLFSDHVVHACTRSQWTYLNLYYDVQCKWGTWGVYKQYRSAWEDYLYKEWMRMYCILCAHLKYRINFFPVHEMVR